MTPTEFKALPPHYFQDLQDFWGVPHRFVNGRWEVVPGFERALEINQRTYEKAQKREGKLYNMTEAIT